MSVYQWSLTAAANANADSNINWAEGQPAASVNNSARAQMAAERAYYMDLAGGQLVGGSANAITITNNQAMASLVSAVIGFFAASTNSGATTLAVDGLAAKPLQTVIGTDLLAGQITAGNFYMAAYSVAADKWVLQRGAATGANYDITSLNGLTTPLPPAGGGTQAYVTTAASTGTSAYVIGTLVPSGFTLVAGVRVLFPIGNTNLTTTNTANVNATGAKNIVKRVQTANAPIAIGDLVSGEIAELVYDGTSWVLLDNISAGIGPQVTLASATTTDLGTLNSHDVLISGVTTITGFGSSAHISSPLYLVTFSGILTLTHAGGTLNLPGSANIITAAGDWCWGFYNGSGQWTVLNYMRATGRALIEVSPLPTQTGNAGKVLITDGTTASWDSKPVTAATTFTGSTGGQFGGAKNVASLTRNSTGFYSLVFTTNLTLNYQLGITIEDASSMPLFRGASRAVSGFNIITTLANGVAQDFGNINVTVVGGL